MTANALPPMPERRLHSEWEMTRSGWMPSDWVSIRYVEHIEALLRMTVDALCLLEHQITHRSSISDAMQAARTALDQIPNEFKPEWVKP